jgi:hypothetical protein
LLQSLKLFDPRDIGMALNWRAALISMVIGGLALLLGFAHFAGFLRLGDTALYDIASLEDPGKPPKILILRSDPAFVALGSAGHERLVKASFDAGAKRLVYPTHPGIIFDRDDRKKIVIGGQIKPIAATKKWTLADNADAATLIAAPYQIIGCVCLKSKICRALMPVSLSIARSINVRSKIKSC